MKKEKFEDKVRYLLRHTKIKIGQVVINTRKRRSKDAFVIYVNFFMRERSRIQSITSGLLFDIVVWKKVSRVTLYWTFYNLFDQEGKLYFSTYQQRICKKVIREFLKMK